MKNLEIQQIKITDLIPAEYNPRKADKSQYEDLKKSIQEFGLVDPIIVNSAPERFNIIIGGHFRIRVAQDMGIKEVPVVYVNIPDLKREQELNIRLNRNLGEFDFDLLANFSEDLLLDIGFTEVELDGMFDLEGEVDPDVTPAVPTKPKSKLGDLWTLGSHKILCGDCTIKSNLEKLMNGRKADLLLTDPPYGIDIVKNNKKIGFGDGRLGFKSPTETIGGGRIVPVGVHKKIIGDNKSFNPQFLFSHGKNQIIFGGNYFADKLPNSPCWLIWDKREDVPSNNFADCEIMWTSFNSSARIYRHLWSGLLRKGNRKEEMLKREHPTQKPVGLLANILKDYSKKDNIILDLFLGSGSTLIACEKTGRVCYGMEIEPQYISVCIERWVNFTGNKIVKVNGKEVNWESYKNETKD